MFISSTLSLSHDLYTHGSISCILNFCYNGYISGWKYIYK